MPGKDIWLMIDLTTGLAVWFHKILPKDVKDPRLWFPMKFPASCDVNRAVEYVFMDGHLHGS